MSYIRLKPLLIIFALLTNITNLSLIEDVISKEMPYKQVFYEIREEQYISLTLKDYTPSLIINYLHFSTYPINSKLFNMQQIIYSNELIDNKYPSTNSSDKYSFKFSKNANLFTILFDNTEKIYLTIKCNEYPCSFNFEANIEEENANLKLEEDNNFYLYSSNSISNDKFSKIKFKFPSGRKDDADKYQMTITVINPKDLDGEFIEIKGIREGQSSFLVLPKYKINNGVIYSFNEKNVEEDINGNYTLEITSMEYQFITLIIKSSIIENDNYLSEITPNSIGKYSYFISSKINNNECYKINENYIKAYLNNNDNNDLLYVSIDFFTKPIYSYFKYSNSKKVIENNQNKESINSIISKENNEYPQICLQSEELNSENSFMIQIHHINPNNKNIDIYNPIISGFFYKKILPPNSLALFTHNSDIHKIRKLMFYLKPIQGNPVMYNAPCEDYPNCFNTIVEISNHPEVIKAQDFGDIQFSEDLFTEKRMDYSPYGPFQNLLYVYCPNNNSQICQFDILISSDLDEIFLRENEPFYAVSYDKKNGDTFLYKLKHQKGGKNYDYFEFCINVTNDDAVFDTKKDINKYMNILEIIQNNNKCYRYQLDKRYYNYKKNDTEIIFNIHSKGLINYILTNKAQKFEYGIDHFFNINYFTFPFELNIKIDKNKIKSDLLFNVYLNDDTESTNFNNTQIGIIILDKTTLDKIEDKQMIDVFDKNSLKQKLDIGTRTAVVIIDKEYINNKIKSNDEDYYIHILIYNNDNNEINYLFNSTIFTLERAINNDNFIENNTYINDKLNLKAENTFNFYNIKSENKDIIELKFSSNHIFDDKYFIAFKKYNKNDQINFEYFEKDTLKYEQEKIGQMYSFKVNNNDKSDIIFAVLSKIKKEENKIQNINYIFKYNTYLSSEYGKRIIYEFKENFSINNNTIEFSSIKIKGKKKYPKREIYIRKIMNNKKIENENIYSYSILESEYELIKGTKTEENGIIKITDPQINSQDCEYSIIINLSEENEKFVISDHTDTDTTDILSDHPLDNSKDDELWWKILIPVLAVVLVVGIIIIVICVKRGKGELKERIMKTSFQENDGLLNENDINGENEL